MMYSLDEIGLLPSSKPTDIRSRKQVNPYDGDNKLPIFVSPMTSVLDDTNYSTFDEAGVIPILPRNIEFDIELSKKYWMSISLQEFEKMAKTNADEVDYNGCHVLVDIANGHIKALYDLSAEFKTKWNNSILMVGNIANPEMYRYCCASGIDYVRCGVGGGSVCTTSVVSKIHSSLQYIVLGINKIKEEYNYKGINVLRANNHLFTLTKVIADGGVNTIGKAMVCLGIGYDYVMMGKMFAQCEEACGQCIVTEKGKMRKYYGMASEQGQIDISGGANKSPEGIETFVPVIMTLNIFTIKFEAALRSSMSYAGAHNLKEFRENTKYEIMSESEFKSYYK